MSVPTTQNVGTYTLPTLGNSINHVNGLIDHKNTICAPYSIPYIIHWLNEFGEPISYDTVCTFGGSYDMVHCNMPT